MKIDEYFYNYVVAELVKINNSIEYYASLSQHNMPDFMIEQQVELQYKKHIYEYFLKNCKVVK